MTDKAFTIPEIDDLVAVTIDQVVYYGYVCETSLDVRFLLVCVEFVPGSSKWFELKDIKRVEYPKDKGDE